MTTDTSGDPDRARLTVPAVMPSSLAIEPRVRACRPGHPLTSVLHTSSHRPRGRRLRRGASTIVVMTPPATRSHGADMRARAFVRCHVWLAFDLAYRMIVSPFDVATLRAALARVSRVQGGTMPDEVPGMTLQDVQRLIEARSLVDCAADLIAELRAAGATGDVCGVQVTTGDTAPYPVALLVATTRGCAHYACHVSRTRDGRYIISRGDHRAEADTARAALELAREIQYLAYALGLPPVDRSPADSGERCEVAG